MKSFFETSYDEDEKIWYGPKRKNLYNGDLTVGEVALEQLRQNPQKIIQIMDSTGETLTAKELVDYALNLSKNLMDLLLRPQDVIGLYAKNTTHVATVMLASFLCGTPVNALFPGFDLDNVSSIYNNTRPKIIFCDVENYEIARQANEISNLNAAIYLMNGEMDGVANIKDLLQCKLTIGELQSLHLPCYDVKGDETAVILCSSGTTGVPKGVMCPHYTLINKDIYLNTTIDSVVFTFSNMYWASGLLTLMSSFFHCLTRIITDKPFTPEYFLYLVEHYKITHLASPPSQIAALILNIDPSAIRTSLMSIDTLLCGGAKVPEIVQTSIFDILSNNKERPGFCVAYGMSEVCGCLSLYRNCPHELGKFSEGKLAANEKMRIVDRHGNALGPNEQGEIVICSPCKFVGYYNNPEATKKAIKGSWIHSGDIGYFDESGFLHVCSRESEIFKSNNFQVFPQQIEEHILKIPGVGEVCVVGVPDLVATNLIACAVVRLQDENGANLTEEDINQYVGEKMASVYHLTGGVHFLNSLPKTGSGKIQRKMVLELIQNS